MANFVPMSVEHLIEKACEATQRKKSYDKTTL
jgi:hypothetical protein